MLLSKSILALAALATAAGTAHSQVPDTDIWIAEVTRKQDSIRIGTPRNVTDEPGYDNQPYFLKKGGGFLFTRGDSVGSTDIFLWEPGQKEPAQITYTPESEYSPTPFDEPRKGFCTVRVEADSTQRLWRFDMNGENPRLVLSDVDSVGYFAWIDEDHVALFVLGNEKRKEPHTLRVVDVTTQHETIVARDIGRAMHRIPGSHNVSFVVHEEDDTFRFFLLERGRNTASSLIDGIGSGQDAAWLDDVLLMASGSIIYAARPARSSVWKQVDDLSSARVGTITRMTVSPDRRRIAFVAVAKPL